jgi:phytoene desaturase (3,4-didehydrolycopene-forming)
VDVRYHGFDGAHCTGAGVGGVATAARLAKAGYDVTVIEKNDFTGGRCSLINDSGYVCSTFPSPA